MQCYPENMIMTLITIVNVKSPQFIIAEDANSCYRKFHKRTIENMSLLVIIFIIKLLAQNCFKIIRGKYGQNTLKNARKWEKLTLRLEKINCDLKFLLQCRRENIIPKFAKPKLNIYASYRLKQKIAKTIIDAEITNKHQQKKKARTELKQLSTKLKEGLAFATYQSLEYRIRNVIHQKKKRWQETRKKKLGNIKSKIKVTKSLVSRKDFAKNVVHNFSSYIMFLRKKLKHHPMESIITFP